MPVVAIIGAAIGAEVIGGAIVTGLGLAAQGIGASIAMGIGGAIGGALGGGVNSVMQGGDFWDGAKGGALGGALSGAFQGIGGFAGIKGLLGAGDAAAAATGGLSASSAIGASAEANPYALTTPGVTPSLAETATSAVAESPYSFSGASLGESAAGLGGPSLGGTLGGVVAGSAPTTGALGSSTGMKSIGQVGSQGSALDSLGKYFQGQDPMKLAGSAYDYYDKSQIANQARKSNRAVQARYNQLGNQIWDTGNSMLANATSNTNTTKDRVNAVFAKYGMKGN